MLIFRIIFIMSSSNSDSDTYVSISCGSGSFNLPGSQALIALITYAEIFGEEFEIGLFGSS